MKFSEFQGSWALVWLPFIFAFQAGCAAPQSTARIQRMQAHIQVLEQKIAQMERMDETEDANPQAVSEAEVAQPPAPGPEDSLPPRIASAPERAEASVPYLPEEDEEALELAFTQPSAFDVQQALKNAGFYEGNVDGELGPISKGAVREFQRIHGLEVDGVVGYQTWKRLKPYVQAKTD